MHYGASNGRAVCSLQKSHLHLMCTSVMSIREVRKVSIAFTHAGLEEISGGKLLCCGTAHPSPQALLRPLALRPSLLGELHICLNNIRLAVYAAPA